MDNVRSGLGTIEIAIRDMCTNGLPTFFTLLGGNSEELMLAFMLVELVQEVILLLLGC